MDRQRNKVQVKAEVVMAGWIAVDFDGTLSEYGGWQGDSHVGKPIKKMVDRVKTWLDKGRDVRIFTSRVAKAGDGAMKSRAAIEAFCMEQFGRKLIVTAIKDKDIIQIWDDKAVGVRTNSGDIE